MHKLRRESLLLAVAALFFSNGLSVTSLGRSLTFSRATTASNIKRISRLLENKFLQRERIHIYQRIISRLIRSGSTPLIHVDWSCINAKTNLYVLRAALSAPGRSLVIYEQAYSKKYENNHAAHKRFLCRLKTLLPTDVIPTVITDAGFRAPWFSAILSMGWNFVGRLRNKNLVYLESTQTWHLSSSFFQMASYIPQDLGRWLLTKDNKVPVQMIAYKAEQKNRHKLNINKKHCGASKSKRYAKASKEPWILVTSLSRSNDVAKNAVAIYQTRMQIEESFRDTKSRKYGFGLNESRTRKEDRMNILLLIATLASFAAWLAGLHVKQNANPAHYQAASKKTCSLSIVSLGREALRRKMHLPQKMLKFLWEGLYELAFNQLSLGS